MPAPALNRRLREALPLLPFLAIVVTFLLIPTVTVIVNAFFEDGTFSLGQIQALFSEVAGSSYHGAPVVLPGDCALAVDGSQKPSTKAP